jgi:hypothetical protein
LDGVIWQFLGWVRGFGSILGLKGVACHEVCLDCGPWRVGDCPVGCFGARGGQMELEASEVCGCIACEQIYFPSEIVRWLDGETTVCPRCGVDAVVGRLRGFDYARGSKKGS